MNWTEMDTEALLNRAVKESFTNRGVVIFKHSTRCSISSVAKARLDNGWDFKEDLPTYLIDLIQYRSLSNLIAEKFNIAHESPQLLLIKDGECVYHNSHMNISVRDLHSVLDA